MIISLTLQWVQWIQSRRWNESPCREPTLIWAARQGLSKGLTFGWDHRDGWELASWTQGENFSHRETETCTSPEAGGSLVQLRDREGQCGRSSVMKGEGDTCPSIESTSSCVSSASSVLWWTGSFDFDVRKLICFSFRMVSWGFIKKPFPVLVHTSCSLLLTSTFYFSD